MSDFLLLTIFFLEHGFQLRHFTEINTLVLFIFFHHHIWFTWHWDAKWSRSQDNKWPLGRNCYTWFLKRASIHSKQVSIYKWSLHPQPIIPPALIFEIWSLYVVLVVLKLSMWTKLASNAHTSSCLCLHTQSPSPGLWSQTSLYAKGRAQTVLHDKAFYHPRTVVTGKWSKPSNKSVPWICWWEDCFDSEL